jgi:hypothetical protein
MKVFKRTIVLHENNIYYIIHDIGWLPSYPTKFSFQVDNEWTTFILKKSTKKYGLYYSEV